CNHPAQSLLRWRTTRCRFVACRLTMSGVGGAVCGADRGGDLSWPQSGVCRRRSQNCEGVTNGGVVFGEAARSPEQAPVAFTFAQGCDPPAESLHIKTSTRHHPTPVHGCGAWVEEVPQARRIYRRRFDQAGALQLVRPQVTIGLPHLRRRGENIATGATKIDLCLGCLPRRLLPRGTGREIEVQPARRGTHQRRPPVHESFAAC